MCCHKQKVFKQYFPENNNELPGLLSKPTLKAMHTSMNF